jgi:dGTPase
VDRTIEALPASWEKLRSERLWAGAEEPGEDAARRRRKPAERDRDRILYSAALQRLSAVTQVTAPELGHSFHNRLGHTLKVAQVGRRNVERLHRLIESGDISRKAAEAVEATDPDAVEAACLAHDLGHPPFGHIAEEVLHQKAKSLVDDGFEGNAQSFRIVTRLAVRNVNPGLDLTRETLDSILKYPWKHWVKDPHPDGKREKKWGVYEDDGEAFAFARACWPKEEKDELPEKSLGAEIMDWADDLTYAVHDVDDFFRAGLVPLDRLRNPDDAEIKRFRVRLEELKDEDIKAFPSYSIDELAETVQETMSNDGPGEPYTHTTSARADLREFGSKLITEFLEAFVVSDDAEAGKARLQIDPDAERKVAALKMLVRVYVIHRPGMAVVQHGQRRLIAELFDCYLNASDPDRDSGNPHLFPPGARERLLKGPQDAKARARVVLDLISGLTESSATQLHHRLCGVGSGPALDAIASIG